MTYTTRNRTDEVQLTPLARYQRAAILNPFEHFAFYGAVGSGKTFLGAHFVIKNRIERPGRPFLISANTYDQLSQATLATLFQFLQEYGFEYVQDRRPPKSWGRIKPLKQYFNTVTIYDPRAGMGSLGFTRVLSNPDSLRGIQFEDYWIDEARDTTQYAHDMVIARQRGYERHRGLITTTTNGESWDYHRFVKNGSLKDKIYGSMHVTMDQAIKEGVATEKYKQTLLRSYSPLMIEQEIYAKHVNIHGGRAYYCGSADNCRRTAPWGDSVPDTLRPLIVGCDFNFQPAPCVWVVGQTGPIGSEYESHIHWFGEINATQVSTESMARMLSVRYPGFFYRIYGDASGTRGTTSNAGETDYNQIGEVLASDGAMFTIDVDQANPLIRDRVENVNALLKNGMGEIRMTYNPDACPMLDSDIRIVGWQKGSTTFGKLDSGGDVQRTHASDAVGYACWKILPPGRQMQIIESIPSAVRSEFSV